MNRLLIYDISNDRLRTKVAEVCKDYGLRRVQYSAFFGYLTQNYVEELQRKIRRLLKDSSGWSIIIFPLSEDNLSKVIEMHNDYRYEESLG
jgi:CRISPR-associated protein Cas2